MSVAKITINGVDGSNDDLPINTLVQLGNDGDGGEATFAWTILAQPPGAADVLSSGVIANPTLTPKKEGSYLLQLVVDAGLPTQTQNTAIVGVRQLKSNLRVPAAGETTEVDPTTGWAEGAGAGPFMRELDARLARPGCAVAVADATVTAIGQVVAFAGTSTIKNGLPGQEILPKAILADPNNPNIGNLRLGIVIGAVKGGAIGNGTLVLVLLLGVFQTSFLIAGAGGAGPTIGDPVYLGAAGQLSLALGGPQVGSVMNAAPGGGGNYIVYVMVDNR